jgi:hypothetical protein
MQVTVLTVDMPEPERFEAVPRVGQDVLLVRDNKIIGEGWAGGSAYGMVSIEMRDERAKALIENSRQVQMWGKSFPEKKFKYSTFKFWQGTGEYVDMSDEDADMKCEELVGVRVVDKHNFEYGMVPKFFESVEGYRGFFNKIESEQSDERTD